MPKYERAELFLKPGDPDLLNARCWIKSTQAVMIDSAVKDCTSAIDLSSTTYAALDSRALVWFRIRRYEDPLRDLDAALLQALGGWPEQVHARCRAQSLGTT